MGPLTYKVFNLYSFIRCETYNSHLYTTTLPLKCESIYSACFPFKRKLLLVCIVVAGFSANGPILLVPPLLLSTQTDRLPWSNRALIPLLGSPGSPGSGNGPNVQDHKRLEHHTLTQNLKAMGSLSYISFVFFVLTAMWTVPLTPLSDQQNNQQPIT